MNERAFERHALSAHLGLARPTGGSQEFSKNEQVNAFNRVLKAGLKLKCPVCTKNLTSSLGFYHHHSQCGKDVQPVKCPKCDWFFKPLSLPQHLRKHERQEQECGGEPAVKRRRTKTPAAQSRTEGADSDDPDAVPENGEVKAKRGYTTPRCSPHPAQVAKWRRRLAADGTLRCELPGCQFSADAVDEMVRHFPACRGMPTKWKVYSCNQCKKRADSESEIVRHIKSFHPYLLGVGAGRPRSPERPSARGRRGAGPGTVTADMGGELTYFTAVERQACAREHAALYWNELPKSRPLASARLQLADWWRCSGDEQNCYSPPMKLSPAYKVQELGEPDPYRSYERLDTFAFEELDNGVLCFCGGPVTGLDWCPRPAAPPEQPQYLAVSCVPVVDRTLPPTEPSSLPAAVQLWSFSSDRRKARMEYALCVDGGPVWDLLWCPLGQRSSLARERLGLLALACGDGRTRVYTMPAPASLPDAGDESHPFYIKRPDLRLEVFGEVGRSPCCRIDWAKTDGNRTVTGIFGNGTVVLWDITSVSPILRDADGPTKVVYPVQVIPAHRGHGTAVAMCPASDRFLCSGGRDRTLQLWDREEPAPIQRATNKLRPMLTDVCWPVATKKLINAYDHSLFVGSPSVMMSDAAMPVVDVPFFTHGAKCTSLAVNSTVNGVACASESGLVALAQWRNMLSHKQKAELRRLLLKLDAEKMTAPLVSGSEQLLGDQYMQVWESCGITIWEAKMKESSGIIMDGFDEHVSSTGSWVSNYPFVAVNKR
ncbi:general transcription factor 3C polypeptide 2-like [Pollicipes pollicipes]|uniref:general transcription factor 3C polypeptide 2-like n=1 Tax=Pollicipes pollicipes TaxID=41117 RepID=UPI001884C98D|nr:general transcription factor 3C polypeptide 2-like [Pollicipes pollicipes]